MSAHRSLRVVESDPDPEPKVLHQGREATETEALLLAIVPELIEAEATVRRIHCLAVEQARQLAKERGVAFIRDERIRQEFGND